LGVSALNSVGGGSVPSNFNLALSEMVRLSLSEANLRSPRHALGI
jgi:hypothetical protein